MRILALNYEFPPLGGGAGNATARICRELTRLGCEVRVLTSGYRGLLPEQEIDGYVVRRVPVLRRRVDRCSPVEMGSFIALAALPALQECRRFRPDIIHVYFSMPTGPVGLLARLLRGVPYLLSLRGGDVPGFLAGTLDGLHRVAAPLNRWVWDRAAVVVANSDGLRDLAQKSLAHGTVQMVPNGVDLEEFRPREIPRDDGRFRILFAARLVEPKGLRDLLEALPGLPEDLRDSVELEVVGAGPDEAALQRYAASLRLDGNVRFSGWASREEMPERYRSADAFVLPSFEEGMSNVILEAMASGLPIITTDIYGNRELVRHGDNGLLVPVADAHAIADGLRLLMEDHALRQRLGRRSRERAAGYGWDATARAYLDLSRRALGIETAGAAAG